MTRVPRPADHVLAQRPATGSVVVTAAHLSLAFSHDAEDREPALSMSGTGADTMAYLYLFGRADAAVVMTQDPDWCRKLAASALAAAQALEAARQAHDTVAEQLAPVTEPACCGYCGAGDVPLASSRIAGTDQYEVACQDVAACTARQDGAHCEACRKPKPDDGNDLCPACEKAAGQEALGVLRELADEKGGQ